jgi:hypothetical protein
MDGLQMFLMNSYPAETIKQFQKRLLADIGTEHLTCYIIYKLFLCKFQNRYMWGDSSVSFSGQKGKV